MFAWALVSEPGQMGFQIFETSDFQIFDFGNLFLNETGFERSKQIINGPARLGRAGASEAGLGQTRPGQTKQNPNTSHKQVFRFF